jgi:hypothetical protein
MPEIRTVRLDPPQPCGIVDPVSRQICGRPAVSATVEAAPVQVVGPAGFLLVLPICDGCARIGQSIRQRTASQPPIVTVTTMSVVLPDHPSPGALREAASIIDQEIRRLQRDAGILRERADEIAARN